MLNSRPLPIEAQISPIKCTVVEDFNNDGFKDLFVIGNHYGVEVETVRYDAGYGAIFLGDGANNFKFLPPNSSGIFSPSDSRFITPFRTAKKEKIYMVTNNNDSIALFKNNIISAK